MEIGWFILAVIAFVVVAFFGIINLDILSIKRPEFELVVSPEIYDEISLQLRSCKWHAAVKEDSISMDHIVLVRGK